MTTAELLIKIRDILLTDAALAGWAVTQFGKNVTIYTGVDLEDLPKESEYPVIVIGDIKVQRGNNRLARVWDVNLGFGIINNTKDTSVPNAVTYTGFGQVEEFRHQGENALIRSRELGKVNAQGDAETLDLFPEFVSLATITIEKLITRRNLR